MNNRIVVTVGKLGSEHLTNSIPHLHHAANARFGLGLANNRRKDTILPDAQYVIDQNEGAVLGAAELFVIHHKLRHGGNGWFHLSWGIDVSR